MPVWETGTVVRAIIKGTFVGFAVWNTPHFKITGGSVQPQDIAIDLQLNWLVTLKELQSVDLKWAQIDIEWKSGPTPWATYTHTFSPVSGAYVGVNSVATSIFNIKLLTGLRGRRNRGRIKVPVTNVAGLFGNGALNVTGTTKATAFLDTIRNRYVQGGSTPQPFHLVLWHRPSAGAPFQADTITSASINPIAGIMGSRRAGTGI